MVTVFIVVVAVSRYISLGSIVAALCFPVFVMAIEHYSYGPMLLTVAACALIVARHHENIRRLVQGNENEFSLGRK